MTTTTTTATAAAVDLRPGALRAVAVLEGIAAVFTFVQFLTAGEFVRNRSESGETWQDVHGWMAYGVLVPTLVFGLFDPRQGGVWERQAGHLRRGRPAIPEVDAVVLVCGVWGPAFLSVAGTGAA